MRIATTLLLIAVTCLAAPLEVVGGLEEFAEVFPDADSCYLYYQGWTADGTRLFKLALSGGEPLNTGLEARFIDGRGAYGSLDPAADPERLVFEVRGAEDWNIVVLDPVTDEAQTVASRLGDLQPSIGGHGLVAFTVQTAEGGHTLALWTEQSGVVPLDLPDGNYTFPCVVYAAPASLGDDPLEHPAVIIYQSKHGDDYHLRYLIVEPGGEIARDRLLLNHPRRVLCPEVANTSPSFIPADGERLELLFHGLEDDGKRDLYRAELTIEGDVTGDPDELSLELETPQRLTEHPAEDKYPELYYPVDGGAPWVFFASYRDGDYDLYAFELGSTELYQLLDEPMTQTAPYVHYHPGG